MNRCEFCRDFVTEGGEAHIKCAIEAAHHNQQSSDEWKRHAEEMQAQAKKAGDRVDEIEKDRDNWKEYAELLGAEIHDMCGIAFVHGWKSKRVEQGKRLRAALGIGERDSAEPGSAQ